MSHALESFALPGRVAVVTGAASGIGRATARLLAAAGARVVLGDLDQAGLEETADQVRDEGGEAAPVATDVTSRASVDALVRHAVSEHGRLDVLANVAGILLDAKLHETSEEVFDRILAVNTKGTLFGCQAAAAVMKRDGGSIVNIASTAAYQPHPGYGAYAISKAGVVAMTRALAFELGRHRVRVNAIAPSYVDTAMTRRYARTGDGGEDPEVVAKLREGASRRNPLRIAGEPEDIARGVLYLASDASRYMTGQVLHLNGGDLMV